MKLFDKLAHISKRLPLKFKMASFVLISLAAYAFSPLSYYGFPEKTYEKTSPSGAYRVEYYDPNYSPYAFFAYRDPFFVKIYSNVLRRYVYTSKLDSGYAIRPISWPELGGGLSVTHEITVTLEQLR